MAEHLDELRPTLCTYIKSRVKITIPYRARDPKSIKHVVESHTIEVGRLRLLVFKLKGLRPKYLVCLANSIDFSLRSVDVYDVLSGLRLRVRKPVIVLDGCVIETQWEASFFVLKPHDFTKCSSCFELSC